MYTRKLLSAEKKANRLYTYVKIKKKKQEDNLP